MIKFQTHESSKEFKALNLNDTLCLKINQFNSFYFRQLRERLDRHTAYTTIHTHKHFENNLKPFDENKKMSKAFSQIRKKA